ncbi:MAG TPA: PTS sugar transporter subunit IIC [Candidatus Udaeobacter sp.]|nr:PTS sugar transporter subunit IIC [Candidatus Udaeobacter sp.]
MTHGLVDFRVLATLAVAGIAVLDATPVAQTLISQPLVTAAALGAVWGDWRTALEVGLVLQILSAATLPLGARTPEDYASGGVIGVAIALMAATLHPFEMVREACAMIGVVIGLVASILGVALLKWQRRRNEGLSRWCEEALAAGHEGALAAAHRAAIVLSFAIGVAYCAAWLALSPWIAKLTSVESLRLAHAWNLAQPLWLGLGVAQLLHAFVQRRLGRAALYGMALVAAWLVLMVGTP